MGGTTVPETSRSTNGKVTHDGAANPGLLDTVRGFGVMVGGPVLLVAAAVGSVAFVARSLARGRLPRPAPALGALAVAGYVVGVRPWHLAWGVTPDEVAGGDSDGCGRSTRGVTIDAPADEVWPWVAQLGQDRGGFYSYEWLENLAGCRMRNADRIHPEWQHREIGETVYLHPVGRAEGDALRTGPSARPSGMGHDRGRAARRTAHAARRARVGEARARARLRRGADRAAALRDGAPDAARDQGARRGTGVGSGGALVRRR